MSTRSAVSALLVLLALAAGAEAQQFPTVLAAIQQSPQFSSLAATVTIAGTNVTNVLGDPNLQAIIFAPNDAAFAATLQNFPGASNFVQPAPATLILLYHVVPTPNVTNATLALNGTGSQVNLATGLTGQLANTTTTLSVKSLGGNLAYAGGLVPGTVLRINETISAGRSTIYTLLDNLVIPPSRVLTVATPVNLTIAEALAGNSNFSTLLAVIRADPVLNATISDVNTMVTVFAPTNAAFAALLASLNTTAGAVVGSPLARRLVLNHIIPLRPFASRSLPTGNTTLVSANPGDFLTVSSTGGANPSVTVRSANVTGAAPIPVIEANITGGKSVIHAISAVIVPNLNNATTNGTTPPPANVTAPPPANVTRPPPPPSTTNVTNGTSNTLWAAINGNGLTTLATAVQTAGLAPALQNPALAATLFGPTNAALAAATAQLAAIPGINVTAVLPLVLSYHLANRTNFNLTDGLALPTFLAGPAAANFTQQVVIRSVNATTWYVGGIIGGAFFRNQRIAAGNSSLYVIDAVITPPGFASPRTVSELLATNSSQFSTLQTLIRSDALVASLANSTTLAVTIFAPTNDAFTAFFNRSNLTLSGVQGSPAARRILLTHILPSFPFTAADDIPQGNTTVQNANNATGEVLTITRTGNNVTVRGAGNTSPVRVIQADLPAAMSAVHVVNGVLLPPSTPLPTAAPPPPPPTTGASMASASLWTTVALAVTMLLAFIGL